MNIKNKMEEHQFTQITFSEGSEPIPCTMYIDMVIFSEEDSFNPLELSEIIQIKPTATWRKGDLIRKNLYRKETCWRLETSHIKTFDLEDVYKELMDILKGKISTLGNYVKVNNLRLKIEPVITVSNSMPTISITKEMQETLLLLHGIMDFDMYFAE